MQVTSETSVGLNQIFDSAKRNFGRMVALIRIGGCHDSVQLLEVDRIPGRTIDVSHTRLMCTHYNILPVVYPRFPPNILSLLQGFERLYMYNYTRHL